MILDHARQPCDAHVAAPDAKRAGERCGRIARLDARELREPLTQPPKLGVVPQQIAGGDIYPALEKGTIDGAEWVGPYDDEKLGFNKVATYYYYPGWWEGGPMLLTLVNEKKWNELPKAYQSALAAACGEAAAWMPAKYDAQNPPALRRLVAGGTKLRPFPKEVMEACEKAAFELYGELMSKSEHWKRVYPQWKKFRDEQFLWFRVAESTYDNYAFYSKLGEGK